MGLSLARTSRALTLVIILCVLSQFVLSAPAVVPDDATTSDSAIAPVVDTGSYDEVFASAEDPENSPPVVAKIPTKEETGHQIHVYDIKPLTFAHRIEGTLRTVGLEEQTNVILDSLCLLAYAYLLRLTSKSRGYVVEIIQFLGFFCFPALPIVQFCHNLFRTCSSLLREGGAGLRYALACVVGQYATLWAPAPTAVTQTGKSEETVQTPQTETFVRQRLIYVMPHELDFSPGPKLSPIRRVGGLLLALTTFVASITTLHVHLDHPVRSDWDSVGIASDERHGWLSSGGTLASLLSVAALFVNSRWQMKPDFVRPGLDGGLLTESEVFAEIASSALLQDLVGGLTGTDSFIGYVVELTGNRWGALALLVLLAAFHKRIITLFRSPRGPRAPSRRGSGASLSQPTLSILAVLVCIVVGGYHIVGQAWMLKAVTYKTTATAHDSLSAGMSSPD